MFKLFDWPFRITRIDRTAGYRDQNTSEWVPENEVEVDIKGNFDIDIVTEDNRDAANLGESGGAVFYTSAILKKQDSIKVYLDAAEADHRVYRVIGLKHDYGWIESLTKSNSRRAYDIILEEK